MYRLTLQLHDQAQWHDAVAIAFVEPEKGLSSPCEFGYTSEYVKTHLEAYDSLFCQEASARLPVDFGSHRLQHAPAFLYDIAPAGAAKRFLLRHIGREKPEGMGDDLFLLGRSTPAPIGNLRIKESAELLDYADPIGFAHQDVITRDQRFLEYAYERGAAIGGATGAGGEAPKLLMTEAENGLLYPDAVLADERARRHWFIKFARNQALADDQQILRAEYLYYKALQQLGIETVATEYMALEEGTKPSLWLERFDRQVCAQGVQRFAVESMYSLCGVTEPGSRMGHLEAIEALAVVWKLAGQGRQLPDLVADYLRRDLINKILGNADNHGHNTAIIRTRDTVRLAPIYDLAPMVIDQEGITRTTKWPASIERAGDIDWQAACAALAEFVDPGEAFERLRLDARHLLALPDILSALGLPDAVMNHPAIALGRLERRMVEWGLA
ncbi:HipA domain-containing protein [Pseudomonas juntendi]|uniref:HipA domain-containing protein n=1 Tax=Pseudomonas juntendi TaxID=2666183 RepID=A0A7W2Q9A4_9PSED|nr:HipA domain-containing protein [Pseudomonas juntendi]MBA6098052.1 HipA domain-containing protein [Pseudomonas juntendi]